MPGPFVVPRSISQPLGSRPGVPSSTWLETASERLRDWLDIRKQNDYKVRRVLIVPRAAWTKSSIVQIVLRGEISPRIGE